MKPKNSADYIYDKGYYRQYEDGFRHTKREDHRQILKLGNFERKDRVLDFGCGYGTLLEMIHSDHKKGIESNEYAVNYCVGKGLNVVLSQDLLKEPDKYYDDIILNEVIEHIPDPEEFLKDCKRILKEGGTVIITTPAKSFFLRNIDPAHCSEMSVKEMRRLLEKVGFETQSHQVSGIGFLSFLLERIVFRTGRSLRGTQSEGQVKENKGRTFVVKVVKEIFDRNPIMIGLNKFRSWGLAFGNQQLIIARKK